MPHHLTRSLEQGLDEALHFAPVSKIGDTFLMVFESDRFTQNHGDLRLAVSRDGGKFRRVHPRTPLVSTGPTDTWDENLLVTTMSIVEEDGDEVWLHYFGCPNVFKNWPQGGALRESLFYPTYMGLAILPQDRFAYAAGPGTITTHPATLGPGGLWLNTEGDPVAVDALDPSGKTATHGTLGTKRPPGVYRRLQWSGARPAALRIPQAEGSRLYSYRG
jgi:hypothetical protein